MRPLLSTQPVAIRRRIVPQHTVHRTVARWGELFEVWMLLAKSEELLHCDFLRANGETAINLPSVHFVSFAHHELHRTWDHHHRLTLTVDVPLRRRLFFVLRQSLPDAVQPFFSVA